MSRRTQLIQSMRRNSKQQGAPHIIILPRWASRDGEPIVTWALDCRKPTRVEIAAAIAEWKRAKQEDDTEQDTEQDTQDTQQPGHGAGDEEKEENDR